MSKIEDKSNLPNSDCREFSTDFHGNFRFGFNALFPFHNAKILFGFFLIDSFLRVAPTKWNLPYI